MFTSGIKQEDGTRKWQGTFLQKETESTSLTYLKQLKKVESAYNFVRKISEEGGTVLFVGTKKQAKESIEQEAKRCGMFYVNQRWLGGMLTNYKTIKKRIDLLRKLEKMEGDGTFAALPKKEVIKLRHKKAKLEKFLNGIKDMKGVPDAMFVVDPRKERIAIKEAQLLGIPIVGIVDTTVTQMRSIM